MGPGKERCEATAELLSSVEQAEPRAIIFQHGLEA